ncbi:GNAT family N-acetyltransferase [Mycobacterium sp. OTB74]|uniref:GNAT family N-acetyltransferase n=1 Tax=Mycobacterium sp. OTB74 TaxID=1853452 RepID=UPI0024734F1F|nr:GNAT family N-acetyltransferase [Mycobacterium sp. OTB74]MDH6244237.1 GNAT superfamily N-acetyltransferase [Mycobacterium sp. OTB74]
MAELEFRAIPIDSDEGAGLVGAMEAEMAALYADVRGGLDLNAPEMPKAGPTQLGPPNGVYLVGYRSGVPVCAGGLKRLPDGSCEIKRMYVVPGARRQGLARILLRALEDAARGLGYTVARLDTGVRQPHAQRLYESEGYRPIGNFNGNPVAHYFGEKQLLGASAATGDVPGGERSDGG